MQFQEGVQTSRVEVQPSSELQVKRTTAAATALLALALVAGHPAPAKAETPVANNVTVVFVANPEYDAIIASAKRDGKNPVEVAMAMKQEGKYTFAQFRAFSKYYWAKLEIEEAQIDQKLISQWRSLIGLFEWLVRKWKFTKKEADIVNRMYTSDATPKVIKDELFAKFGKYLTNGDK